MRLGLNDLFLNSLPNYTSQPHDKGNFVQDDQSNFPLISYLYLHSVVLRGDRMSFTEYTEKISPLCPVAIKVGQSVVHAPEHSEWGVAVCDFNGCGERFKIGLHRFYGTKITTKSCVKQLEQLLADDHANGRIHANSYELPD